MYAAVSFFFFPLLSSEIFSALWVFLAARTLSCCGVPFSHGGLSCCAGGRPKARGFSSCSPQALEHRLN